MGFPVGFPGAAGVFEVSCNFAGHGRAVFICCPYKLPVLAVDFVVYGFDRCCFHVCVVLCCDVATSNGVSIALPGGNASTFFDYFLGACNVGELRGGYILSIVCGNLFFISD